MNLMRNMNLKRNFTEASVRPDWLVIVLNIYIFFYQHV